MGCLFLVLVSTQAEEPALGPYIFRVCSVSILWPYFSVLFGLDPD